MARIRTIKPSFWGDNKTAHLSRDARLLFLGLVSMADDEGRFLASNPAIIGYVFPHDEDVTAVRLTKWLTELHNAGLVVLYQVGRLRYGYLPTWGRHQAINRPSPSTLPKPPRIIEASVSVP